MAINCWPRLIYANFSQLKRLFSIASFSAQTHRKQFGRALPQISRWIREPGRGEVISMDDGGSAGSAREPGKVYGTVVTIAANRGVCPP